MIVDLHYTFPPFCLHGINIKLVEGMNTVQQLGLAGFNGMNGQSSKRFPFHLIRVESHYIPSLFCVWHPCLSTMIPLCLFQLSRAGFNCTNELEFEERSITLVTTRCASRSMLFVYVESMFEYRHAFVAHVSLSSTALMEWTRRDSHKTWLRVD